MNALRPEWELMVTSLLLALALDVIYPEHKGLLLKLHPVHTSYIMALKLGKPYSGKLRGLLTWIIVMTSHIVPFALALIVAYNISPLLWIIVAAITLKLSASLKLLLDICYNTYLSLKVNLNKARRWVQLIVRRNVYELDEPRVVSATIESLAESLVDGFTSPLIYYALLGPLGAMAQRIANTLDGALGFKTPEYSKVGWFSAKADTILNLIPARLTALIIALSASITGRNIKKTLSVWTKWCRATESLNAGHPIAAMAGALEVRLEKPGYYVINDKARLPEPHDIMRALRIAVLTSTIWIIITLVIIVLGEITWLKLSV